MAKLNENYEAVVIFSVQQSEEELKALIEKFSARIAKYGTLEGVEEWGKRTLAYPINDETDGHYVIINFESGADFPAEFERIAKITDGVLRLMIVRK